MGECCRSHCSTHSLYSGWSVRWRTLYYGGHVGESVTKRPKVRVICKSGDQSALCMMTLKASRLRSLQSRGVGEMRG